MTAPSPQGYLQGQGNASADGLNTMVQEVTNLAQLRSFTPPAGVGTMTVCVLGTTTPGDGGLSFFYWNATATAADNNSTVIAPAGAGVGRWLVTPFYALRIVAGENIEIDPESGTGVVTVSAPASGISGIWEPNVPSLASFTQRNVGSSGSQINAVFSENSGVGITVGIPDFSGGSRAFCALTVAVPTAPYHIVLAMSGVGVKSTSGISVFSEIGFGFYDGTAEYLLTSLSQRYSWVAALYTTVTAAGTSKGTSSFPPINFDGRNWYLHIKNDSTTVYMGISSDGATNNTVEPLWIYSEAISGGSLSAYSNIALAFGVLSAASGSGGLGPMNASLYLYDTTGTRAPGPPGWKWS